MGNSAVNSADSLTSSLLKEQNNSNDIYIYIYIYIYIKFWQKKEDLHTLYRFYCVKNFS